MELTRRSFAAAAAATALAGPAQAQGRPIRVALIADSTGPLEAYAKQTIVGFRMGLERLSGGTMAVAGRRIEVIERDSQTKPDVGRTILAEAFSDLNADIAVGGTSSAVALAMLPVAEEYKKILIVEPAVADSITGERWNRYIFRTGRNSSQDAISNAVAIGRPGVVVATLAQDYAFGRDGVKAFRDALAATGARLVHEEYAPVQTTDFTAPAQRIFDALAREQGEKVLFVLWAGGNPLAALQPLRPERFGIKVATGGNILPAMAAYKAFPGMEGATYYYYEIPKNPLNDWLVEEHRKRFSAPPDFFTAGGFAAAMAVVTHAARAGGDKEHERLIAAKAGMEFDTPKGRMVFRREDHQALQSMFGFRIRVDPNVAWAIPEATRELGIADMRIPIQNRR